MSDKIELNMIIKDNSTKEISILKGEFIIKDVQCLFKNEYGCFVSLKKGQTVKVDHKLEELEQFFLHGNYTFR